MEQLATQAKPEEIPRTAADREGSMIVTGELLVVLLLAGVFGCIACKTWRAEWLIPTTLMLALFTWHWFCFHAAI